jgi:hypothetical protein
MRRQMGIVGLASLLGIVASAAVADAGATKLVIVSRPARSSVHIKYASSDPPAGFPIGPGAGPANASATFLIESGQSRAKWTLPAGAASVGGPGWTVNDAHRALYRNRTAPAGPTGVDRALVIYGLKLKIDAKSEHDAWDPAPLPSSSDQATVGVTVTNGSDTTNHCTKFPTGSCIRTSLDSGTGTKVVCTHGIADPSCTAIPVCGNGIREQGEQCDGGAACGPTCGQGIPSCCQGAGVCQDAPLFSLYNTLANYCSAQMPGSTASPGGLCMPDGSCVVEPVAPLSMCCQQTPSTCFGEVEANTGALWHFQNVCRGAYFGTVVLLATCAASGVCEPGY